MSKQELLDAVSHIDGASAFVENLYKELELRGDTIRELLKEKAYMVSIVREMRAHQKAKRTSFDNPIDAIKAEIKLACSEIDVDRYVELMGMKL